MGHGIREGINNLAIKSFDPGDRSRRISMGPIIAGWLDHLGQP
jgi:hypothetical protein